MKAAKERKIACIYSGNCLHANKEREIKEETRGVARVATIIIIIIIIIIITIIINLVDI